ncbi:hypothetical protein [Alteromonas portus]|uniref:hypothetical protein n=1 Tax=Alteromonas portus TaxID=2565549 RepID=UPI003BF7EDB5
MNPNDPINQYEIHQSDETVPEGNLLRDISPSTLFRAFQIMFAKHTIKRKKLPLRLDLSEYQRPDYQYDKQSTMDVAERLKVVSANKDGMKWLYKYDGELQVEFFGKRHVNIPFDDIISRVDISRVGDCFRDVLGITTKVLHRDEKDRPTLQIERIAALAQPNYSAFLGKDELDVYKLEYQEYEDDRVINWMRTVCCPNSSTVADDSYLSLSRADDGNTDIEFVALQQFALPRIMRLLRLDRIKWYREYLTRGAYKSFWFKTSDNIVAQYKGFDVSIGKEPNTTISSPTAKEI